MILLHEDASFVVIDKPAGRIVHPAPGHETGSLTEELVRLFPEMASVGSRERPGVVHRLDIDTSGVLVFARTQAAYLELRRQFKSHEMVKKTYLAVCHGVPKPPSGTITAPVGRDHQSALTHYKLLGRQGSLALLRFDIETGRMHQIRIHASKELGCPIVGDPLYGDATRDHRLQRKPTRTLLHAVELSFLHPVTKRRLTFTATPPTDLIYCR